MRLEAKCLGTTLHGLRHLFGAILAELSVPPDVIQECLHHISPLSQQTYTKPTSDFVNKALTEAAGRAHLDEGYATGRPLRDLAQMLDDLRNKAKRFGR
jgi:integrase